MATRNNVSVGPPTPFKFSTVIPGPPGRDGVNGATGAQGPPGSSPLNGFFFSPADQGKLRNQSSPAGNFTVGTSCNFARPCTIQGVRFFTKYNGTKTWKVSLLSAPGSGFGGGSTLLSTVTSAPLMSGDNTVSFSSPVAITNLDLFYAVQVWDVSGLVFAGFSAPPNTNHVLDFTTPFMNGPSIWQVFTHLFFTGGGDGFVDSNGSSDFMCVEPAFTVP
jgi:hypothetical protein